MISDRWAWFDERRLRMTVSRGEEIKIIPVYRIRYLALMAVTSLMSRLSRILGMCSVDNLAVAAADIAALSS